MIVLKILLWVLLGIVGLVALVLLLLCVSLGIRLDNRKDGKMKAALLIGPFAIPLKKKKKDPKKEAKKKQKAEKRAAKKQAKRARKQEKLSKKKPAKKAHKVAGKKQKAKPLRPKSAILRSLLYSWRDYDYPYWKLIKIKELQLYVTIGGKDSADVGKKHAYVTVAVSNALPHLLRLLDVRKYQLHFYPDFVNRKTSAKYKVAIRIRPIVILYAGLIFFKSFLRNQKLFSDSRSQATTPTGKKEDMHGKQQRQEAKSQ